MRRYILTILGFVLAVSSGLPAADGDGGYAGAFMQIPIGARPTAMGGAYLSISDDGAGALYNPAGVATIKQPLLATAYRLMNLDRSLGYAALMLPAKGNSTLGLLWRYAGSGSVMARSHDGDPLGNELSHENHEFSVVFAKRFEHFFSAGVKMYYLHSSFAEMQASSVGFDMGLVLYMDRLLFSRESTARIPVKDVRVGLVLKHLQAKYIWNNEDYVRRYIAGGGMGSEQQDPIPLEYGIGVSGRFLERKLVLVSDLIITGEQGAALHTGLEYYVKPIIAVRSGFSDGRFVTGAGYVFKLGSRALAIDYAFSTDRADEGSEHIFSFDLLF
ncbi:MAG: hypothetical protein KAU35_07330 [candidate division Zixibacteria bacterium]|nr:hypothetical protein [candidate division Zixibacteria bacterium]